MDSGGMNAGNEHQKIKMNNLVIFMFFQADVGSSESDHIVLKLKLLKIIGVYHTFEVYTLQKQY